MFYFSKMKIFQYLVYSCISYLPCSIDITMAFASSKKKQFTLGVAIRRVSDVLTRSFYRANAADA